MATKSILKSVRFNDPKLSRGGKHSKAVHLMHVYDEIKGGKIKDFLNDDVKED